MRPFPPARHISLAAKSCLGDSVAEGLRLSLFEKKGQPNSLPLPHSLQEPGHDFLAMHMLLCLALWEAHALTAHAWKGVEFAWSLTQDDAGGFELAGNAFQIDPAAANVVPLTCVSCSFMA